MTIEDLIEINTEESLMIAEKKINKMELQREKQKEKVDQLEKQLELFQKYHQDLTVKEEKLLENIKLQ